MKAQETTKKEFKIALENQIRAEDAKLIYAADKKSKTIWRVINSMIKYRNNSAHESSLTAEELNELFRTVGEKLLKQNDTFTKASLHYTKLLKNKGFNQIETKVLFDTNLDKIIRTILKIKNKTT